MRTTTAGALATVSALAALLGGCGSSSRSPAADPSATVTSTAVPCRRYAETAQRIADAQAELYSGRATASGQSTVERLAGELEALETGAPAEVANALADLADGFRLAQQLLSSPSTRGSAQLKALTSRLAEDGTTISTWIQGRCH